MLEKLVQAVTAVEHRKAAYGRGKADGPQALSDVTQVGMQPRILAELGHTCGQHHACHMSEPTLSQPHAARITTGEHPQQASIRTNRHP